MIYVQKPATRNHIEYLLWDNAFKQLTIDKLTKENEQLKERIMKLDETIKKHEKQP